MATKQGLFLLNLGSPPEPTRPAVARYLTQFLTDPYVIDIPWLWRQLLVRAIIVPFRAGKSAHAYQSVWRKDGSPLTLNTRDFAAAVRQSISPNWDVRWAMRYSTPSIAERLKDWDVDHIFVVPLYPQYAESSTQTALDEVAELSKKAGQTVSYLNDFYAREEFIASEVHIIQREIDEFKPDHLLLSFHGLPEHHLNRLHPEHCHQRATCCAQVTQSNQYCYRAQCLSTVRAISPRLKFDQSKIHLGFQSRLGRKPWIKPYTDIVISDLIKAGARRVLVGCPSFVADCLETLEEIQIRLRDQFKSEGGEELQLIPSLNVDPEWINNFNRMMNAPDLEWRDLKQPKRTQVNA